MRAAATEQATIFLYTVPHAAECRRLQSVSPATESPFELAFTLPRFLAAQSEREQAAELNQRFGLPVGAAKSDGVPQVQKTRQSCDAPFSKHLAAAQQYLQALREEILPPVELRKAWEAFYRACDPLVRRTIADCSLHRADEDDGIQEAWAEIAQLLGLPPAPSTSASCITARRTSSVNSLPPDRPWPTRSESPRRCRMHQRRKLKISPQTSSKIFLRIPHDPL